MVPKCRTIRETVGLRRVRGRYLETYVKGERECVTKDDGIRSHSEADG